MTELKHNKTYKYIGINEVYGSNHTIDKEKMFKNSIGE